jgi:hypothetical protein
MHRTGRLKAVNVGGGLRMREHESVIPDGFSLFDGGPLVKLLRRSPILRQIIDSPWERVVGAVVITWLPMLVLSIHNGLAFHSALPFFKDWQTHARFLVTLPLYVFAGHHAHTIITPAMELFWTRGLVQESEREKFISILRAASGWNHSFLLRLVLYGMIVFFGHDVWKQQMATSQASAWYGERGASGIVLTQAGYWFIWIANPLLQFMNILWGMRLLMFAVMLARIAALDLHLVATHPDHAGGLGFLGDRLYCFFAWLVAVGTTMAGILADRIFYEGRPLTLFKLEIGAAAVIATGMVLGPMCVFAPRLLAARRTGLKQYSELANRYVRDFEEAWIAGKAEAEGRSLLGASDIQSMADMANTFQVVTQMRSVPFSNRDILYVVLSFLLPIAPLLLTVVPLEELINKVIHSFLG